MEWWKQKNGLLQIYPRSYMDSGDDGVGDLRGLIQKLPYIKGEPDSLGIDAIWLSPFYTSPMADFGYDVADFCDVDPLFGTLDDFKELLVAAHQREIAVMIDIVPNHTSSEHAWFQEALSSKTSEKRDYYIFRDGKDGGPPNNWLSVFGGSAWELDESSGQYYLHSFLREQPDLNWQNPEVQAEMRNVIKFWCELGVDGFRTDAVRWMGKDISFRDDDLNPAFVPGSDPYDRMLHNNSRYSPELETYLRVLTSEVKKYPKAIILFEDYLDIRLSPESQTQRMYSIDPAVSAPFNFQGITDTFSPRSFAQMVKDYETITPDESASIYCLGNHDKSRLATRAGIELARVLAFVQLCLPGLPVVYYGDEIGMADVSIADEEVQDPFEKRVPGKGLGRDPARTPMQWDDSLLSGFTRANRSWLPVAPDYKETNVVAQQQQPHSVFQLYRTLLRIRRDHSALRTGKYHQGYIDESLYMFWMAGKGLKYLIVANMGKKARDIKIPGGGDVLCMAKSVQSEQPSSDDLRSIEAYDAAVISYVYGK